MPRAPHMGRPLLAALILACLLPGLRAADVLPPPAAEASTPHARALTLAEARELALANNKGLGLARLNIDEKHQATAAASKDYFPKLTGGVYYFRFNDDLGTVLTIGAGARGILLPVGGVANSVAVFNQNSTISTLFVAQPITKLIAVNAAVQIARADEHAARAQLDKGTRDLLSGVTQAYHGLLGAQRIQAALLLQIILLEQVFQAQPAPALRVALVEARQGLLQVRGQVLELNATLNSLLDLPPCTVLTLVDPLPPALPVHCAEDAAQVAVSCSPEVREAEQSIAKARAALRVACMNYLPDVNLLGGYLNQTASSYIQPNIGFMGVTGTWTFWEWGKKRDLTRQRHLDVALAQQNVQVTIEKVQQDARKAYIAFEQTCEAYRLAGEMVEARKEAEKAAAGPAATLTAKGETSKAELEQMKAEIAYRVAHAQLEALLCEK